MLTKKQIEERRTGIGGSDVAALLGYSKWKTPVQLFLEKTGQLPNEENTNEFIYWGNVLEPVIRDEYSKRNNVSVTIDDITHRHLKHNFMIANVDGWIEGKKGLLECKTAGAFKASEWGDEGCDNIPTEYLLQCAHYAAVCDVEYVDIAVLIGGQQFKTYRYDRNSTLENQIIDIESNFWNNHVLKNVPPEIKTQEDVNLLYPANSDDYKQIDDSILFLVNQYKAIKDSIKELEEKMEYSRLKISEAIGLSSGLKLHDLTIATYKLQSANRFDVTKFKTVHPDLYKQFTKESQSRVLKIK